MGWFKTAIAGSLLAMAAPALAADEAAGHADIEMQPAVEGIFSAFAEHPLVGLGDDHGLAQGFEFYIALVRDPRFAREVGNVVVEFGAGGRQDVVDRYVAGESVPYEELRTVWSDTVGWIPNAGWLGVARFLAAVREVNRGLAPDARIRVELGEPPIDWRNPAPGAFMTAMSQRDTHPAQVIETAILGQGKKALVIYGGFHFGTGRWLRGQVEARHPGAFFVVLPYAITHHPPACGPLLEVAARFWPVAALASAAPRRPASPMMQECATLTGTAAGVVSSGPSPVTRADAVIFYGPPESLGLGPFLPDYLFDADYRRELARRVQFGGPPLMRFPPGWRFRKSDYAVDLDAPGYGEKVEAIFARYDGNRDGAITADEYADPVAPAAMGR